MVSKYQCYWILCFLQLNAIEFCVICELALKKAQNSIALILWITNFHYSSHCIPSIYTRYANYVRLRIHQICCKHSFFIVYISSIVRLSSSSTVSFQWRYKPSLVKNQKKAMLSKWQLNRKLVMWTSYYPPPPSSS